MREREGIFSYYTRLGCLSTLFIFPKTVPSTSCLFYLPFSPQSFPICLHVHPASSPRHLWSSEASSPLCGWQMTAPTHLPPSRLAQKGACHRPVKQAFLRLGLQTQHFRAGRLAFCCCMLRPGCSPTSPSGFP